MIKKIKLFVSLSLMAVILCGLSQKLNAQSVNLIKELQGSIMAMGESPYDRATYDKIKIDIKEAAEISKNVDRIKEDLYATLDCTFCGVLTRDMNAMLDGKCGDHKKLNAMKKDLDEIIKVVDMARSPLLENKTCTITENDVKTARNRMKKHSEILSFVSGVKKSRVKNVDVTTNGRYDMDYIGNTIANASKYDAERKDNNLGCESLKNGIAKVPQYLDDRHVDFLERLVNSYVDGEAYSASVEREVKYEIQVYFYKDESGASGKFETYKVGESHSADIVDELYRKMNDFKDVMELKSDVENYMNDINSGLQTVDKEKIEDLLEKQKALAGKNIDGLHIQEYLNQIFTSLSNLNVDEIKIGE